MDVSTVDNNYAQLQQQAQQTTQLFQNLATKLQTAAAAGNADAREWLLDLKEIALGVQAEQNSVAAVFQSIHAMIDNHVSQTQAAPQVVQAQPQYVQQGGMFGGGGGMLQRFLGGGFGQAMVTGAGFGIGDALIQDIFN